MAEKRQRICLGLSGSIAAVKGFELAQGLVDDGFAVDVVFTTCGRRLAATRYKDEVPLERLEALARAKPECVTLLNDADEWDEYRVVGTDPVLHIEVAKRCDLLLIAPLCANTLASVASGHCGSLLTSIVRAWPYDLHPSAPPSCSVTKPFLVAPSMNTVMYFQSITHQQLDVLRTRGVSVIEPVEKKLACGDIGKGAMAEVIDIRARVATALSKF
eukprot:Rhum_TRINITY_DN10778_c0_g1::Rhum_TRINITY_DN10778_c0_g1_i1::g.39901::m.39901/K01598/PPCDC, coaC; phosphopantothenoylcysteine decarboxylase